MPSTPGWKKQITRVVPGQPTRLYETLGLKPPFKAPDGRWRTKSLFAETRTSDTDLPPVFTLGYGDRVDPVWGTLPSFQRHYIELEDPTGYKAAYELLGSWPHWRRLQGLLREEGLDRWNEEIADRLRASLVRRMQERAAGGDTRAAAWIVNKGWEQAPAAKAPALGRTDKPGRGRPSNEQIKAETKRLATEQLEQLSDAERIGLVRDPQASS